MMGKYIIKKVNGWFEEVEAPKGNMIESNTLLFMQNVVGGYLEAIYLPKNIILMVNEEGMINGSSKNFGIVQDKRTRYIIYGDVIFTSVDAEGDTIPLNDEQIAYIKHSKGLGSLISENEAIPYLDLDIVK